MGHGQVVTKVKVKLSSLVSMIQSRIGGHDQGQGGDSQRDQGKSPRGDTTGSGCCSKDMKSRAQSTDDARSQEKVMSSELKAGVNQEDHVADRVQDAHTGSQIH